ncbi:hypothetical protein ANANG_G00264660 [Anguilla anguilla]|uniref:Uncharacterized protein n=1 Tax=Anguilla anguilla TaxID=7936 RepID=A0A9D3LY12_ANGAN|nr:hypothetical protein ANANG_G00264660 [Anguilla anguilla]
MGVRVSWGLGYGRVRGVRFQLRLGLGRLGLGLDSFSLVGALYFGQALALGPVLMSGVWCLWQDGRLANSRLFLWCVRAAGDLVTPERA